MATQIAETLRFTPTQSYLNEFRIDTESKIHSKTSTYNQLIGNSEHI